MAVSTEVRSALKKELSRLEKEKAELDKTITSVRSMLRESGERKQTASKKRASGRKPGKRQKQVLDVVAKNPGITASEIAKACKMKHATSVYPVLKNLQAEKLLKKSGKGFKTA